VKKMDETKVYVDVLVHHCKEYRTAPLRIMWEDDAKYRIVYAGGAAKEHRLNTHAQKIIFIPLCIEWEDGANYKIDLVTDVTRAASLKAGGTGIRYTIKIGRATSFLYLEEDKWFVERRRQPDCDIIPAGEAYGL
jgi:hypothetical protein